MAKFKVGDNVVVYERGQLRCKTVSKVCTCESEKGTEVTYLFDDDRWIYSNEGTSEKVVFASKNDFIEHVKSL